jgi:hypothetical protein
VPSDRATQRPIGSARLSVPAIDPKARRTLDTTEAREVAMRVPRPDGTGRGGLSAPSSRPARLGDHVSWIYHSDRDLLGHTAQFTRAGLDAGNRVVVLTASLPTVAVTDWLHDAVPGFEAARGAGRVEVLDGPRQYLATGRFEPDRVTASFAEMISATAAAGYPGLWVCADMTWSADTAGGAGTVARYEARANRLYASGRVAGVCQYDGRRFGGADLDAVCAAHPITPGQATLRFHGSDQAPHLAVSGEVDASNQPVLAALLDQLPAGDVEIDATDLRFADGASAWSVVRLAATRPGDTVTVRCTPALARVLRLVAGAARPRLVIAAVAGG